MKKQEFYSMEKKKSCESCDKNAFSIDAICEENNKIDSRRDTLIENADTLRLNEDLDQKKERSFKEKIHETAHALHRYKIATAILLGATFASHVSDGCAQEVANVSDRENKTKKLTVTRVIQEMPITEHMKSFLERKQVTLEDVKMIDNMLIYNNVEDNDRMVDSILHVSAHQSEGTTKEDMIMMLYTPVLMQKHDRYTTNDKIQNTDPLQEEEKAIKELVTHFQSDSYFQKLCVEYDGNEKLAKSVQNARITLTKLADVYYDTSQLKKNMTGVYVMGVHDIHINPNATTMSTYGTLLHELGHASSLGDHMLSEQTKKKLTDAIDYTGNDNRFYLPKNGQMIIKSSFGIDDTYFDNAEMFTRKLKLDLRMEKLGIKEYKELFTRSHYDQLWESYDSGALDSDEMQFMEMIKNNFETYKLLFDTIADTHQIDGVRDVIA